MLASVTYYTCIVQGKGSQYIPQTVEIQTYQTSPEGIQMKVNKSELLCCGPYEMKESKKLLLQIKPLCTYINTCEVRYHMESVHSGRDTAWIPSCLFCDFLTRCP